MEHEEGRRKAIKIKFTGLRIFTGAVVASVITVIIIGLFLSGSPKDERLRQFDSQRLLDLQQIAAALDAYWNAEGVLPEDLEVLLRKRGYSVSSLKDPGTGEYYEYRITGSEIYELCANFDKTFSIEDEQKLKVMPVGPYSVNLGEGFWQHGPGHTCYTIQVRKDLYKYPVKQ